MPKMPREKITEEAFNKCFFSKGYYQHDKCEYETSVEETLVNCANADCDNSIPDAKSQRLMDEFGYKIITVEKKVCRQCQDIRNHIVYLEDELDSIIYNLPYDIKKLKPCNTMLDRVNEISIQLRILSSYLSGKEQGNLY